jgi:glycosyltransferase involved in cell wall biosynthesis
MKIIILGTRGIPNVLGGIETHCEELYPRLVKKGHEITIITRTPYVINKFQKQYKGVRLKHLYAPKTKPIEAIVHTILGVLYAAYKRPDILHIHAVGPMIMTPLAKLFGLKVIITNHGPDYDRQKWGKLAKTILKIGEYLGTKTANEVIVISEVINTILKKKYSRNNTHLIYNGVNIPKRASTDTYIKTLGLSKKNYIIAMGRFVAEKGFHDLISSYTKLNTPYKLVIVGDADHETTYSKNLKKQAIKAGVILTGFIKGEELNQIFSYAKLFVMPSYHEGLPIALLEAMSYRLNVLVSNIPANLEVKLDSKDYFLVGNIENLKKKLGESLQENSASTDYSKKIKKYYNWDIIAEKTLGVYKDMVT